MVLPPAPRAAQPLLLGARRQAAAVGTSLITDGGRHRRDDQKHDDEREERSGEDGDGARQPQGEQSFHLSILRRVESSHLNRIRPPACSLQSSRTSRAKTVKADRRVAASASRI